MDLSRIEIDIVAAQICESVFTDELKERGVVFYELSGSQHKLWQNHHMFKRLLQKRQYDVAHLNIFQGLSLYYAYLAENTGVPVRIAHSHNSALRRSKTKCLKMILHNSAKKILSKNATDFWACSKSAAKFMFPSKYKYEFIPNGIDIEKFRFNADVREEVRRELGLADKLVIGNIGRLCYQKNQDFLLDVFAEVQIKKPDSVLLLVGDGELKVYLQQKAERLGIADKVFFYGVTDKVEKLLWAMDLFVFPSRFEGLGIAVVEAQTAGLSVVCSDIVPAEALITTNIVNLPLENSAEDWTVKLLKMQPLVKREDGADKVLHAGFDIAGVAAVIEEKYFG